MGTVSRTPPRRKRDSRNWSDHGLPCPRAHPYTPPLVARTKKGTASNKGAAPAAEASDDRGIDEILDGLEEVVVQLESGDLPLEDALRRFEDGVKLARRGSTMLDAVEQRVEQLLADRDETVPFANEESP